MSGDGGLDVIAPPTTAVSFRGAQYQVGPLRVGQIPAFARAIRPMLGTIIGSFGDDSAVSVDSIMDAIADHGEQFIEAVSIASGIPVEQLREADAAEFLALVPIVLRVNRDFLKGRLSPAIAAAIQAAKPATSGIGQTP